MVNRLRRRSGERAAIFFFLLVASFAGYRYGELTMIVLLGIGNIFGLCAVLEDLRDRLEELRDEIRSIKQ